MKKLATTLLILSYLTVSAQIKKVYYNTHSDTTIFNGKIYREDVFNPNKTVIINNINYNYSFLHLYKPNKNGMNEGFTANRCESTDTTLFYYISKNSLYKVNDKKIQKLKFNDGNPQLIDEICFLRKNYGIARSNFRLYVYDGSDTLKFKSKLLNYTLPYKGEENKLVYYDSILGLFNESLTQVINREKYTETGYYVPRESVQDFIAYKNCGLSKNEAETTLCLDTKYVRYDYPTFNQEYTFYYDKRELYNYTSNLLEQYMDNRSDEYLKEITKTPDSLVIDNIIMTDLLLKVALQSKINLDVKLLTYSMFLLNDSLMVTGYSHNNEYQLGLYNINNNTLIKFTPPTCKFITKYYDEDGFRNIKTETVPLTPHLISYHYNENENSVLCSGNDGHIFNIDLNTFKINNVTDYVIKENIHTSKNDKFKETELVYLKEVKDGVYIEIPWLNYIEKNFLVQKYYNNDNR